MEPFSENLLEEQKTVFWDLIETFDKQGLLPYVMLIGSWSELIYELYYFKDYDSHIRTRDVDFLYRNLHRPKNKKFDLINILKEKGFSIETNRSSGISKFVMGDFFSIEFLIRVFGSGGFASL
ncbi:MAG: nucleotidyltransferase domain-containing protein [Oscillospiraceae bacterium]|nr:nucleotidyltransferase domain-containing protein [Oscillospiraceae bacterium]